MMGTYETHDPDDDGWSRWVQPIESGYRMACCDCGLVHEMDFRVSGDRAQFRARRHVRATAAVRREKRKREQTQPKPRTKG